MFIASLAIAVASACQVQAGEGSAMLPMFGKHSRCIDVNGGCGWQFAQRADGYPAPTTWVYHPGWDFNLTNEADPYGYIYAMADGVAHVGSVDSQGRPASYGELVIEHHVGDQVFYSAYFHCSYIYVDNEQAVKKGNRIAKIGSVGANGAVHLHWEVRSSEHRSPLDLDYWSLELQNPSNVQSWYRDPELFVAELNVDHEIKDQGEGNYGAVVKNLGWYTQPFTGTNLYTSETTPTNCYIKTFENGTWYKSGVVFDPLCGSRRAYTIRTGFWDDGQGHGWQERGGPTSDLGMPITNEYNQGLNGQGQMTARQDFQKGYLYYDGSEVRKDPYPTCAPGWTSSGWNSSFSYLFALAYERNGARNKVGYPTGPVYQYGPYWRQDFTGGSFGNCCIMYDPNNALGNPQATNEAYLLRTGFYEYYVNNGGWQAFGCPSRDEYGTGGTDAIQFFVRRPDGVNGETQFHYMYYDETPPAGQSIVSWHSSYPVQYVSRLPSGTTTIDQGNTQVFTLTFKNTGPFTWHNNPTAYPYDYVSLQSCRSDGVIVPSFLEHDAWIDPLTPCTMLESSVAPGSNATFRFTGRVRTDAPLGPVNVYFRPVHSVGGLMEGWSSSSGIPLNVTAPPTVSTITTLAGDLTGDGRGDVVVVTTQGVYLYRSTGSHFVYDGKIGDGIPKANLRYRLADVEGMGRKQLITFRQDLGFFFQRYDPLDNPPLSTWYRIQDWGPRASDSIAVGDVDGNGREDIIGTRTGETFVLKAVANGNGTWLNLSTFNTSWVPYPRKLLIGEENDDGREDLLFANSDGMYYQSSSGSAFGSNNRLINQTCLPDTPYVGYFTTLHRAGVLFRSSQGMKVFTPTGGPAFNPAAVWSTWKMVGAYPLVADVNADQLDDVVAVYPDRREIAILLNEHGEGFSGPHSWYRGTGSATPFTLQPVAEDPVQALSFTIRQNPIRGSAQFTLTLPEAATVSVSVYDVNGRKVADVADGPFAAGEHALSWTVNHQPAGMYFVRCITPKRSFNRKVVVLQ